VLSASVRSVLIPPLSSFPLFPRFLAAALFSNFCFVFHLTEDFSAHPMKSGQWRQKNFSSTTTFPQAHVHQNCAMCFCAQEISQKMPQKIAFIRRLAQK
jgi:hypothetical protein